MDRITMHSITKSSMKEYGWVNTNTFKRLERSEAKSFTLRS